MIRIFDVKTKEYQEIKPTMFPDGTSQVWKIGVDKYKGSEVKIIWNFEHEAELIHLAQLNRLLWDSSVNIVETYIPYFPYARQDKEVNDESTFARIPFEHLLYESAGAITALDVHSKNENSGWIKSYSPENYIVQALFESLAGVVVFPDSGAYDRYSNMDCFKNKKIIVLDKVRDQSTGRITSLKLNPELTSEEMNTSVSSAAYRMLIVDDICDGGATFARAATFLHSNYKCSVGLYVTHGIFSAGFDKLIDSGITRFYTTKSLPRNVSGYNLMEIDNV